MNKTEIITFLLCELKVPFEITVQVLGRINFELISKLPPEDAAEVVEDDADWEIIKAIARKLYPFYRMGNLKSPGDKKYTLITPELIWSNTKEMYENGETWPLTKLLARYRGLCALGSKSLAYAESQKELLTTSYQLPNNPEMIRIRYELDPTQVSGYIVDLVINMPDVIPPIM